MKRTFLAILAIATAMNASVFCASAINITVIADKAAVAKQTPNAHNCYAYAVVNAERFFSEQAFTGTQDYVAAFEDKIRNLISRGVCSDVMERILTGPLRKIRSERRLSIIDQDMYKCEFFDTIVDVAAEFKRPSNTDPVGILMNLSSGHWVFIGISKTTSGIIQVVIPESANNNHVTPQLQWLRENILNMFA